MAEFADMKTLTMQGTTYTVVDGNAVHFTEQTLTDAQKTQARNNIGALAANNVVFSIGDYTTLAEAIQNMKSRSIASVYAWTPLSDFPTNVGGRWSFVIYNNDYQYTEIEASWADANSQSTRKWIGKYTRDAGNGIQWTELYSPNNKPTAADIGAAPAGYGLGINDISFIDVSDPAAVDTFMSNGWIGYQNHTPTPLIPGASDTYMAIVRSEVISSSFVKQTAVDVNGYVHRRVKTWGEWNPWEWVNPPMYLGVEYRTTEKHDGFPVYTKKVAIPSLPNKDTATLAHGISCTRMLRHAGRTSAGETLPYAGWGAYINVMANLGSIIIESNYDASALTAEIQLWYTKD